MDVDHSIGMSQAKEAYAELLYSKIVNRISAGRQRGSGRTPEFCISLKIRLIEAVPSLPSSVGTTSVQAQLRWRGVGQGWPL